MALNLSSVVVINNSLVSHIKFLSRQKPLEKEIIGVPLEIKLLFSNIYTHSYCSQKLSLLFN